jgi:hypothetical protein
LPDCVDSIQPGHRHVDQDDVRLEFFGLGDQLAAVGDDGRDLEFGL